VHAGCVEPIFEAVLANDPSRITAIEAGTPGAATQRMDEDLLVPELPHQLYRGDTPLHLAAAGLRHDAAHALLHLAVAPTGASGTAGAGDYQLEIVRQLLAAGATLADVDRNGTPVADRIQSQALPDALAAG
jgi:hypothetical protein